MVGWGGRDGGVGVMSYSIISGGGGGCTCFFSSEISFTKTSACTVA